MLAVALFAVLGPIWIGPIPPFTDFGGHVSMADIWIRIGESQAFADVYERREALAPNLLLVRFAAVLHALGVDPIPALRLWTTLALLATVGALLWLARVYVRSRWQVFAALPLLWGAMLGLGLLNYVAAIPVMLFSVGMAQRAGETGRWQYALGLLGLGLLAFLLHGIGLVFTLAMAALVLTVAARRAWILVYHSAFLPPCLLWLAWRWSREDEAPLQALDQEHIHFTAVETIDWTIKSALEVVHGDEDTRHFLAILVVWFVMMAVSGRRPREPEAVVVGPGGGRSRLRDAAARLVAVARTAWAEVQAEPLLVLTLGLAAGIVFLPAYVQGVAISYRLVTPFVLLVTLLPRVSPRQLFGGLAVAVSIALSLTWGGLMREHLAAFELRETGPMSRLIDRVPEGSRVQCIGVDMPVKPIFTWSPLLHGCHGLVQQRTGGLNASSFAATGYNAIRYREGRALPETAPSDWWISAEVARWDYLLVRGDDERVPASPLLRLAARQRGDHPEAPAWTLYEVRHGRQ